MRCAVSGATTSAPLVTSGGGVVSGTWPARRNDGTTERKVTASTRLIAPPSPSVSPVPHARCTGAPQARAARRPRGGAAVRRGTGWSPLASETGRPPASSGASRASRAAPPTGSGAARRAARDTHPGGRLPAGRRGDAIAAAGRRAIAHLHHHHVPRLRQSARPDL